MKAELIKKIGKQIQKDKNGMIEGVNHFFNLTPATDFVKTGEEAYNKILGLETDELETLHYEAGFIGGLQEALNIIQKGGKGK